MDSPWLPAAQEIRAVIVEEVADAGGTVQECFVDGDRLFLRSLLPRSAEVLPGDTIQGGVAVRAADAEILVQPYTLRRVCRNGAIWAQAVGTQRVRRVEFSASNAAIAEVIAQARDVFRACCGPEVFSTAAERMRAATGKQTEMMLTYPALLSRLPHPVPAGPLSSILRRFRQARDTSVFGLMNAITSVARDEPDPETRWRLEELGGAVLESLPLAPKSGGAAAVLVPA